MADVNGAYTGSNNKVDTLYVLAGPHSSYKLRSQNLHTSQTGAIKDTCVTCKHVLLNIRLPTDVLRKQKSDILFKGNDCGNGAG